MLTLLAILLPGVVGLGLWFWAHQKWPAQSPEAIGLFGAAVTLVLVLCAGLWWQGRELQAAQQDIRDQALAVDSLEAVNDTIRVHELQTADGAIQVAERRAVQAEFDRDSVDELLGTERRARVRAEVRVAGLEAQVDTDVVLDSIQPEVRLVDATVRTEPPSPPATVRIRGRIGPERARLQVFVELDPIDLTIGGHCGPANAAGIRPVVASVETGDYLTVGSIDGQFDPTMCNPPPPPPPGLLERIRIGVPYAAGGILVGALGALILMN